MTKLRSLLILLLALACVPAHADITTNLVAHYTFNTNGNAAVGNNATLTNGASITTPGKIGAGAMTVDGTGGGGNDYADLGLYTASDSASAWTYAFWINPSALGDFDQVLTKFVSATVRSGIELGGSGSGSNNDLTAFISRGTTKSGYTNENVLTVGTWTHVCVVFNGGGSTDADKLKIYVDGTSRTLTFPVASIPTTMQDTGTEAWWAGWRDDSPAGFAFNGQIDDLRMYSRALTSGDVTELYNFRESTGAPPQVVIGQ